MAYEEDSANSNVQRVLQQGYQVNMRPRSLPLDVKIEIFKHSNRHHDGIKLTVPEMIAGVAEVQQALANSLLAKHMNSESCAQKGDYTYCGMYAKYAKENHGEMCGRKWETFNDAKVIFHQWEHVFAADQKTSLLTWVLQTIAEWCRQMATSLVSVCSFDRTGGAAVMNFSKGSC